MFCFGSFCKLLHGLLPESCNPPDNAFGGNHLSCSFTFNHISCSFTHLYYHPYWALKPHFLLLYSTQLTITWVTQSECTKSAMDRALQLDVSRLLVSHVVTLTIICLILSWLSGMVPIFKTEADMTLLNQLEEIWMHAWTLKGCRSKAFSIFFGKKLDQIPSLCVD